MRVLMRSKRANIGRSLAFPASGSMAGLMSMLVLLLLAVPAGAQTEQSELHAALRRYGLVERKDPATLERVKRIVARIARVADKSSPLPPIVGLVEALPGGEVAQARGGRFLFLTNDLPKLLPNDDDLAVPLGHEVAHLARGHTGSSLESDVEQAARVRGFQASVSELREFVSTGLEAEADRFGLLYAAMAGYDVSRAIEVYEKILASDTDPSRAHPSKAERQRILDQRLQQILDSVDVFSAGVNFYMRGKIDSAARAFDTLVREQFGTRDVYLNLGALQHLAAFRFLVPADSPVEICSLSFELGSSLDLQGSRPRSATRGSGSDPDRKSDRVSFRKAVNAAIDSYQLALASDSQYAAAQSNLACALLHRNEEGDADQAAGLLLRAAKLEPQNSIIANNLAVALHRQEKPERALAELRRAVSLNADFTHAHYNLGLFLEKQESAGAKEEAVQHFRAYLSGRQGIRTCHYIQQAQMRLSINEPCAEASAGERNQAPAIDGLSLRPGDFAEKLPAGSTPLRVVRVIGNEVELRRFSGWHLLVQRGVVDEITFDAAEFQTAEGIRVGSAEKAVRGGYGMPDWEELRGAVRMITYRRLGLLFSVRDGRVISWTVFRPL